jgi:hypothetical protein
MAALSQLSYSPELVVDCVCYRGFLLVEGSVDSDTGSAPLGRRV